MNEKKFKKLMYFFEWLYRTDNPCEICGVECKGENMISFDYGVWVCAYCYRDLMPLTG